MRWFGVLALIFCASGACKRDVAAVLSLDVTGPNAVASTRAIAVTLAGIGGRETTMRFDHGGDLISLDRTQHLSITFREGQTGTGRATVTACDDRRQRMLAGSVDVTVSDGKSAAFMVALVLQPQSCAAGGPDGGTCTPKTCAELSATCGMVPDTCDGVLSCGDCTAPESCGGGGRASTCGVGTCIPVTCETAQATCGLLGDGCGHVLECGGCTSPLTCGGAGRANQCGCSPTTCLLRGADCGRVADGCGGTLECGTCAAPQTCMGGGVPNVCGGGGGGGAAGGGGAGGAGAGGAGAGGGGTGGGGGMSGTCGALGMECCASNQCNGSLACVFDAGAFGRRCRDCGGIGLRCCQDLYCEGGDCISDMCVPSTSNCDPRPATSASACTSGYACYYANPDTRCVPLGPSSPAGTECCITGNMMSCYSNFCAPGYRCSSYQNGSCLQVCRLGDTTCPAPITCTASTTIAAPYGLCQ